MKFSLLNLLLFYSFFGYAQRTYGVLVKDAQTKEPIPYVHLYNGCTGVMSNEFGQAVFALPCTDTIIVSSIGYKKMSLILLDGDTCIYLEPVTYILNDITVLPRKAKNVKVGIFGRKARKTRHRACNGIRGYSTVLQFDGMQSKNLLAEVSFFVASKNKGEEKLRINILDSNNGIPNKNIINESIIIAVNKKKGWQTVDLLEKGIELPSQPFFIGVEFIGDLSSPNSKICLGFTQKILKENMTWVKNLGGYWHQLSFLKDKNDMQLNLMININVEIFE